jgi:hypothetical protein
MKKQFHIFGLLFLSLCAGMTVSEVLSRGYHAEADTVTGLESESSTTVIAAEVNMHTETVN